jgi:hypothetical protein
MINSNPSKTDPKAAIIVYGRQHAEGLPQAAWFRAEDKQAAKASAAEMKLSVIELKSDAEKALAVGVHEGVLKGSGRMIVGAVEPEVYRRIEEHVSKQPAGTAAPKSADASSSEVSASAAAAGKTGADAVAASGDTGPVAPNPTLSWQSLRVGDSVLAAYWNEKREPEGWWVATVARIDGNEFVLRWPNEPQYPVFKRAPKHVAILHPEFIASGK